MVIMNNKYHTKHTQTESLTGSHTFSHWMYANKLSQFHWNTFYYIWKKILFSFVSDAHSFIHSLAFEKFYSSQKMNLLLHIYIYINTRRYQRVESHKMREEKKTASQPFFFTDTQRVCHCELCLFLICDNLWHSKSYFIFQFCAHFFAFMRMRALTSLHVEEKPFRKNWGEKIVKSIEAFHENKTANSFTTLVKF